MENLKFPIVRIDENILQLNIATELYAIDTINAVCYKYTGNYYVHQEYEDNIIKVTIEKKDNTHIEDQIAKQFCNDLIDQQIRHTTEAKFGHIRDLIVEEAFRPINKQK